MWTNAWKIRVKTEELVKTQLEALAVNALLDGPEKDAQVNCEK